MGQTAAFLREVESLVNDKSATGPSAVDPTFGFDCSGLVYYALQRIGIKNPPRDTVQQFAWTQHISRAQLRPGDLIFSNWQGDTLNPGHVQVYLGKGLLIQSPGTSTGSVQIQSLAEDAGHIVGYGRMPLTGASKAGFKDWTTSTWAELALHLANIDGPGKRKIPITPNNIENMQRWISAESGHGNWWSKANPLNGTGYGQSNGSYPNLLQAAQAFGAEINQKNFHGIRSALASNAPTALFSATVVHSNWASRHYGGDPKAIARTTPNLTVGPAITAANLTPNDQVGGGSFLSELGKGTLDVLLSPGFGLKAAENVFTGHPGKTATDINPAFTGIGKTAKTITSDAAAVTSFLTKLQSGAFWKRIGIGAAGVALIGGGVLIFLQSTKTVQGIEGKVV